MGTSVQLAATDVDGSALQSQKDAVVDYERRWSRFLPDSEISQVNARAGEWTTVSPDTFRLIEAAVRAWEITGGRFDPTVLGALVAAGYDRSFEYVNTVASSRPRWALPWVPGCGAVDLDANTGAVRVAPGTGIDLGGIAKGFVADTVVASLIAAGAAGALANVGGDVRVAGESPSRDGWRVATGDAPRGGITFALHDGAVVTTTSQKRRWTVDGASKHHLIDPGSGLPAVSGLLSVTVVGASAMWAEVYAKAAFVAGPEGGRQLLASAGVTGIFVHASGAIERRPGVEEFVSP